MCVRACVRACVCVCLYVGMRVSLCVCLYVYMQVCAHARVGVHVCVCVCARVRGCGVTGFGCGVRMVVTRPGWKLVTIFCPADAVPVPAESHSGTHPRVSDDHSRIMLY